MQDAIRWIVSYLKIYLYGRDGTKRDIRFFSNTIFFCINIEFAAGEDFAEQVSFAYIQNDARDMKILACCLC